MKRDRHPGGRPRRPADLTEIRKPPEEVRDPRFAELDVLIARDRAAAPGPEKGQQKKKRKRRERPERPTPPIHAPGKRPAPGWTDGASAGFPAVPPSSSVTESAKCLTAGAGAHATGHTNPASTPRQLRRGCLERDVKQFTALLRRRYADQIQDDQAARAFKKRACGLLRRGLPPFAGHPKEDSISRAAKLRKQDLEWKQIYLLVIPNHAQLDAALRRQTESNLRAALRSRRNARRRRRRDEQYLVTADPQPSHSASAPTGPSAAGASGGSG